MRYGHRLLRGMAYQALGWAIPVIILLATVGKENIGYNFDSFSALMFSLPVTWWFARQARHMYFGRDKYLMDDKDDYGDDL